MVITIINDRTHIASGSSYAEEIEEFHTQCRRWRNFSDKIVSEKNPEKMSYMQYTTDTMTMRYMDHGEETTVVVAFVPSTSSFSKEWKYEDRVIQNSQGGETHLKGWYLE